MTRPEDVHKRVGDQKALDGLSLAIRAGAVTTIIECSGSAKSVLMRQMIGLENPNRGATYFDGKDIVGMKASELNKIRGRVGILFQDAAHSRLA
jgi:phospholipid/cholesterol/gamma-HCH transport system ATP-binding protein